MVLYLISLFSPNTNLSIVYQQKSFRHEYRFSCAKIIANITQKLPFRKLVKQKNIFRNEKRSNLKYSYHFRNKLVKKYVEKQQEFLLIQHSCVFVSMDNFPYSCYLSIGKETPKETIYQQ